MKKILPLLLAAALLLCACTASPLPEQSDTSETTQATETTQAAEAGEAVISGLSVQQPTADNYRVYYEIFVGSFSDSNGDGIGDLRGIINRLDYLNDGDPNSGKSLGVEGLWLTPIYKSPSYHKYDIDDYYTVDPSFGTMEDLKELIRLCHERNVQVILDLPLNHTSSKNQWFLDFKAAHVAGDTENEYYDFYSFYSKPDTAPAGRTFGQIAGCSDFYECNFSGGMPELNFDNPAVRQAVLDVAKFYLDMGIDGFRFDAAKYIYFGDNQRSAEFWDWYIAQLKAIKEDIYTVAEVWDNDGITDIYYSSMNCFDFTTSQVSGLITETAQSGDVNRYTSYVESYLNRVGQIRADSMIVPFISNHDMDRASGFLTVASKQMHMAANLYILSSGSPFIYYGEEIGIRGSRGGANTDANRRLAMLWGDGDTVRDPEGTTYDKSKQTDTSVAKQLSDENSLYNYYKKLILLRTANPEIARGEYHSLNLEDTKVGGFTATYEGSTVCVLHNTTDKTLTVELPTQYSEIRGYVGQGIATLDGFSVTLEGQTSVVLK